MNIKKSFLILKPAAISIFFMGLIVSSVTTGISQTDDPVKMTEFYQAKADEQNKVISDTKIEKQKFEREISSTSKHIRHRPEVVLKLRHYDEVINKAEKLKSEYEKLAKEQRG